MNPIVYRFELMTGSDPAELSVAAAAAFADMTHQPEWRGALNRDWEKLQSDPEAAMAHAARAGELALALCTATDSSEYDLVRGQATNWHDSPRKSELRKLLLGHISSRPFMQHQSPAERTINCNDTYLSPGNTIRLNKDIAAMAAGLHEDMPPAMYLSRVETEISEHGAPVDHITLATIFHRLSRFKRTYTDSEAANQLLEIQADRIAQLEIINGQTIGNILYGLQNFTEVPPRLLYAMADTILRSDAKLKSQNIGNALYGLQNLSHVPESLLTALAEKVRSSNGLEPQAIGAAFYGLQNLSHVPESLLTALAEKVRSSGKSLHSQALGNALYGLQSLNAAPESVLEAFVEKVKSDSIHGLEIGTICGGLLGLYKHADTSPSAGILINYLFEQSETRGLWDENNCDLKDISRIVQMYAIYKRELPEGVALRYRQFVTNTRPYPHEQTIADAVRSTTGYRVEVGVLIDGFECDLLITSGSNGSQFCYWVELDGHQHTLPPKKRSDRLKTDYLTTRKGLPEPLRIPMIGSNVTVSRAVIEALTTGFTASSGKNA